MIVHVGPYEFELVERESKVIITVPSPIEANADDLAQALAIA